MPTPGNNNMTTQEQARENLRYLADEARQAVGLAGVPNSDFTLDETLAYSSRLRALILSNPSLVTADIYEIARVMNPDRNALPEGYDADGGPNNATVFFDEMANQAGEMAAALGSVGTGTRDAVQAVGDALKGTAAALRNTSAIAPYILPIAAVLFLVMATNKGARIVSRPFN